MLIVIILLSVLLLGALLIIALLLGRVREQARQQTELAERNQELNSIIHSSELKALRYKLNPHLFKNALNSIQSHAYQTWYSMDKLSGVLDYILYDSDQPLVLLSEEMEFAMNFIEINRLKLSPLFDLSVRNNLEQQQPEAMAELRILPLVTVDLIENAFKHTDFQKNESFIAISFTLDKGIFRLEVRNRISEKEPLRKRRGGLGLKNLEERLKIAYTGKYKLSTQQEGNIFNTHLEIDLNVQGL